MLLNRAIDAKSMLCFPRAGGTGAVGPGVPVPLVPVTFLWKVMTNHEKAMKSNEKL